MDEAAVWQEHVRERRRSTLFALALGMALYLVFGVLDWYIFPSHAGQLLPIRLVVVAYLAGVAACLLLAPQAYVRHSQTLLSGTILLAGGGIVWMNATLGALPLGVTYYAGLILVLACLFGFIPVRFRYAWLIAALLIAAYDVSLWLNGTTLPLSVSNNFFLLGAAVICGRSGFDYEQLIHQRHAHEQLIEQQRMDIEAQKQRADNLLHQILPDPIAARLLDGNQTIADGYSDVTVLFADLAGFTEFSSSVSPRELVKVLNRIFSGFDEVADRCGVEKIKTIGDAYMAACGVPHEVDDHAERILRMALGMREEMRRVRDEFPQFNLNIRIGIHTGPCVAGVIGRQRFIYDLWGDTVNLASRMESTGVSGQIQVTEATYLRTRHKFPYEPRGEVQVKGRGMMMAYLLKA